MKENDKIRRTVGHYVNNNPEPIPKWIVLIPFILALLLILLYHYSG